MPHRASVFSKLTGRLLRLYDAFSVVSSTHEARLLITLYNVHTMTLIPIFGSFVRIAEAEKASGIAEASKTTARNTLCTITMPACLSAYNRTIEENVHRIETSSYVSHILRYLIEKKSEPTGINVAASSPHLPASTLVGESKHRVCSHPLMRKRIKLLWKSILLSNKH